MARIRGRRSRALRALAVIGVGVCCAALSATTGSAQRVGRPQVTQLEFPAPLAAPGEQVEVGYDTREVPGATGFLYARNDTRRAFVRVRLQRRKASQQLVPNDRLDVLRGTVPASVVGGHTLYYYALLRLGGRTVRIPAHATETLRVLSGARVVELGTHRFGAVHAAGAVVARAGPDAVGFDNPPQGAKTGPWSFDIAPDGSVWLLDELDERLLVWPAGKPNAVPRVVPLASFYPWDFARGPANTVYVTRRAPRSFTLQLLRLTDTGRVLWQTDLATTIENQQLRVGPDGTLYWVGAVQSSPRTERGGPSIWCPAASPVGKPYSLARQRQTLKDYQPLSGGRRLVVTIAGFERDPAYGLAPHEERVALLDRAGRLVRAWRIESRTVIWPYPEATPALVGGDPVVVLTVSTSSSPTTTEYEVLRLSAAGREHAHGSRSRPPATPTRPAAPPGGT